VIMSARRDDCDAKGDHESGQVDFAHGPKTSAWLSVMHWPQEPQEAAEETQTRLLKLCGLLRFWAVHGSSLTGKSR
jgi:hypothetical protein